MRAVLPVPTRPMATGVVAVGATLLIWSAVSAGTDLPTLLETHEVTLLVFVAFIAVGELLLLRMPSGRETAPLATATAIAVALVGPIQGVEPFDVDPGLVVLVATTGLLVPAAVRAVVHRPPGIPALAARLTAVAVTAVLARSWQVPSQSLWEAQSDQEVSQVLVAVGMMVAAGLGLLVEVLLLSGVRSERHGIPWVSTVRDELGEAAPLTLAVVVTGPMVALMAPVLGLLALPTALFPLAMAYSAVGQYARNRATNLQLIATLSRLTEAGGYTPARHAERVAELSVRMGRVLGLGDREMRDLEYAALLHDLGQISLRDPIPGGATVLAAPADQRDIAAEGARIIRHAGTMDVVAGHVEGQTTPYRLVREHGEEVSLASRIIKCANAYDDLTEGSEDPARSSAAMERIHLGLGYEYDPEVVDALGRVTDDAAVGRMGEHPAAAR